MKRPRIAGSREYQLAVDMNAEFEGTEELDESEICEMFGNIEIHAEFVFLFGSMLIFHIEDETEMVFVEEVDFGLKIDGCFGGVEFF